MNELKFDKANELERKRKEINILKQNAINEALQKIKPQVDDLDKEVMKLLRSRYKYQKQVYAALKVTPVGTKLEYKIKGTKYTSKFHNIYPEQFEVIGAQKKKFVIKFSAISSIVIHD